MEEMKKYLNPLKSGGYELSNDALCEDSIEVPFGADCLLKFDDGLEFYRKNKTEYFSRSSKKWKDTSIHKIGSTVNVVWKRSETEYLMQGENGKRLMESVEQAKNSETVKVTINELKHRVYKKDVSHLDFIDVYRVLNLFAVEHPCIQHAVKKLLCAGQRGSKGRDQDIQEAIDSLIRFQEMRGEDGNS